MCVGDGTRETPAGGVRRTGMLPWSSGQELRGSGGRRTTRAGVATNRETKINNFCVTLLTTPIPFMFDRKKGKERSQAERCGLEVGLLLWLMTMNQHRENSANLCVETVAPLLTPSPSCASY